MATNCLHSNHLRHKRSIARDVTELLNMHSSEDLEHENPLPVHDPPRLVAGDVQIIIRKFNSFKIAN